MPYHWNSSSGLLRLKLRPSDMKKDTKVDYTFRGKPPRIIVSYTDTSGTLKTAFISIVADEVFDEADLTRFLADSLTCDKDIE